MRYLKAHPIYEGKAELDELMNIIDTTPEGTDLKGLCELEPKRTGRIFVKPRGLSGSKTYIEKTYTNDPNFTRVWYYTSLSNGVPFGGDRFTEAKYAIRDLWAYIISKNAPTGLKKDEFKRWLLDDQACGFHGKGASGKTIIDAYIQKKTPAGMITDADQYFATAELQQKLAAVGLIKSSNDPSWFTLERDTSDLAKVLSELSISLTGQDYSARLQKVYAQITIIRHAIKFTKNGENYIRFEIGGLLKNLDNLEKKILSTWSESIKKWVEENYYRHMHHPNINDSQRTFYLVQKSLLISLAQQIDSLDTISFDETNNDGVVRILADALKDKVDIVTKLPKDLSVRVFKLLGYDDNETEGIIGLKDSGLF